MSVRWEFVLFLAFPPDVRRVIYTTNLIESINARLRKVTRNRGPTQTDGTLNTSTACICGADSGDARTVMVRLTPTQGRSNETLNPYVNRPSVWGS
jgi:Transposase, Mutator family